MERSPQQFDTVQWERKGGTDTGLIREIRGQFAHVLAHRGESLVEPRKLRVIVPREQWNLEALLNHLKAVYGVEIPFSIMCSYCDAGMGIETPEQAR